MGRKHSTFNIPPCSVFLVKSLKRTKKHQKAQRSSDQNNRRGWVMGYEVVKKHQKARAGYYLVLFLDLTLKHPPQKNAPKKHELGAFWCFLMLFGAF